MTYVNAIKYISAHSDILPSPERMRLLCRYLGDPQRQLKFVHIAGSSGKSSCLHMLSSILSDAGYKVGSLTDAFVKEQRELISINCLPVSYDSFAKHVGNVAETAEKMANDIRVASIDQSADIMESSPRHKITKNLLEGKISPEPAASEIVCAAAFLAFFEEGCDIVILECGESRADPTGIIDSPLVSVICGSSFTEEQLRTSTGIIRRGTREVVTSAPAGEAYSAILLSCVRAGSRLTVPAKAELNITSLSLTSQTFEYRGKTYTIPTSSEYHLTNALVAIETVYALRRTGVSLHGENVSKGISAARVPLRFEFFSVTPTIIFDCPKSDSDVFTFIDSLKKIMSFIGKKIIFVAPSHDEYSIKNILFELGLEITNEFYPSKPSEVKALSKRALAMSHDETMIVLGNVPFVGTVKYQIHKAMALN